MKEAKKTKKTKRKSASPRQTTKAAKIAGSARKPAVPKPAKREATKEPADVESPIPAILLEGDKPEPLLSAGTGNRYLLGAARRAGGTEGDSEKIREEETESLPSAYGTKRLTMMPRDPHWIHVYWDLTEEQQKRYNRQSEDGHLVLRIRQGEARGKVVQEIGVHPESRSWYVHTGQGGEAFVGELGFYGARKKWKAISTSNLVRTPRDEVSADGTYREETLPPDLRYDWIIETVKATAGTSQPLMDMIAALRESGHKDLPDRRELSTGEWTEAQEQALGKAMSRDVRDRLWLGSLEITEWVMQQWEDRGNSETLQDYSWGSPEGWSGEASSFGLPQQRPEARPFWFNVNAELIVYGGTRPGAKVMIGGRRIKLSKDGSFSFRFALPDGQYKLPTLAISEDGEERRAAQLSFARATDYRGEVGPHPTDPALREPDPENVA